MKAAMLYVLETGVLGSGDLPTLNVIFIIVVCLLIVLLLYFLIKSSGKNKKFPIEHASVTVADKWQKEAGNDRAGQYGRNMPLQMSTTLYTVRFRSPEGDSLDFSVPEKEYENLIVGAKGTLSYQNQKFLSFE